MFQRSYSSCEKGKKYPLKIPLRIFRYISLDKTINWTKFEMWCSKYDWQSLYERKQAEVENSHWEPVWWVTYLPPKLCHVFSPIDHLAYSAAAASLKKVLIKLLFFETKNLVASTKSSLHLFLQMYSFNE